VGAAEILASPSGCATWPRNIQGPLPAGRYFPLILFLILNSILPLPSDYYEGFVREHRYGLSNLTAAAGFGEQLKNVLVAVISPAGGACFTLGNPPLAAELVGARGGGDAGLHVHRHRARARFHRAAFQHLTIRWKIPRCAIPSWPWRAATACRRTTSMSRRLQQTKRISAKRQRGVRHHRASRSTTTC